MLFQTQSSCSTTDGKTGRVGGEGEEERGVNVLRGGDRQVHHTFLIQAQYCFILFCF